VFPSRVCKCGMPIPARTLLLCSTNQRSPSSGVARSASAIAMLSGFWVHLMASQVNQRSPCCFQRRHQRAHEPQGSRLQPAQQLGVCRLDRSARLRPYILAAVWTVRLGQQTMLPMLINRDIPVQKCRTCAHCKLCAYILHLQLIGRARVTGPTLVIATCVQDLSWRLPETPTVAQQMN
jgi:hypothetical protein